MPAESFVAWRRVPGISPPIQVTACGRVMGWRRGRWKPLNAPRHKKSGYPAVSVGKGRKVNLATLVLLAFVGPKPPGCECRHRDGNKDNSDLSNLAWGTPLENQRDQFAHGTRVASSRHPCVKLSPTEVREMRTLWATGLYTQEMLAVRFHCSQPLVSGVVNDKMRTTSAQDRPTGGLS